MCEVSQRQRELRRTRSRLRQKETDKDEVKRLAEDSLVIPVFVTVLQESLWAVRSAILHRVGLPAVHRRVKVNLQI